ncbi:MAG: CRISPR system precrRNA processing endoribonuclease RAMP protein Cas6 [Nitrospinae bacterium]|nr:CRISPR system precrRNA processing endoribonuclease RAMP protein Cas6 [Nitrospinota bacterium]
MNQLSMRLLTPLRIEADKKVCRRFEFHLFFKNLLRRISNLLIFHHGVELELDFKGLAAKSEQVKTIEDATVFKDWERYSNRQGQKIKMGGLVGDVAFTGDLEEFIPFLILGEAVHAGKYATFGMGKYEISGEHA